MKGQFIHHQAGSVIVALCLFIIQQCALQNNALEPVGKGIGSLRYDAIIELYPAGQKNATTLFARYWAGSNFYRVSVSWAEPHGRGLFFPVYPPSLSVNSTPEEFRIDHDLFANARGRFTKPLNSSDLFTNMFGDYPVLSIRNAEPQIGDYLRTNLFTFDPVESHTVADSQGRRYALTFEPNSERIRSLRVFDNDGNLFRESGYLFSTNNGVVVLASQAVHLEPSVKTFVLPGEGAIVRTSGSTSQVSRFPGLYRKGGRTYEIQYQNSFPGVTTALPSEITLRNEATGAVLCHALLSDFTAVDAIDSLAEEGSFGAFSPAERSWRKLIEKYWLKEPDVVSSEDRNIALGVLASFKTAAAASGSIGHRLRRLNATLELSRMVSDSSGVKESFRNLLAEFARVKLWDCVLLSGQGIVDYSILAGQAQETHALAELWIRAVIDAGCDRVPAFIDKEITRGNYSTSMLLLDAVIPRATQVDLKFELLCLRVKTRLALMKALQASDSADMMLNVQKRWWTRSGKSMSRLDIELDSDIASASDVWTLIQKPSGNASQLWQFVRELASHRKQSAPALAE